MHIKQTHCIKQNMDYMSRTAGRTVLLLLFVEGICISGKNERKQIDKMKNNQHNILTYQIGRNSASEMKL